MSDPRKIPQDQLKALRSGIMEEYVLTAYREYSEQQAAWHLLHPDRRPDGLADTSTLRRNRRAGRVPYSPRGDGRVAYFGLHIADYLLFGSRAVLLWGAGGAVDEAEAAE